jgi:tRNA(Ile)-lysidine synthetase-like protein
LADYELVKKYCHKHSLKLIYHVFEKFEVGNFEAEARSSRYKFLEEIRINNDFGLVLTAHHSDDQIETVFLNFIKGSFIDGMAGISSLDLDRKLWRPLLSFSKKQLIEYAECNSIDFNTDSTNSDSKYLRNFVRNEIIPSVQERVGSLSSIARNSTFYSELATYIDSQVDTFIAEKFINQTLARSDLLDLPNFFRFSLYSKIVGGYDFSVADFWELDKLILTGFASKSRTVRDCKFLVLPGKKIQVLKKVK